MSMYLPPQKNKQIQVDSAGEVLSGGKKPGKQPRTLGIALAHRFNAWDAFFERRSGNPGGCGLIGPKAGRTQKAAVSCDDGPASKRTPRLP